MESAKLTLPIKPTEDNHNCQGERVWVDILSEDGDDITVRVDSDPVATDEHGYKYGSVLTVHRAELHNPKDSE